MNVFFWGHRRVILSNRVSILVETRMFVTNGVDSVRGYPYKDTISESPALTSVLPVNKITSSPIHAEYAKVHWAYADLSG